MNFMKFVMHSFQSGKAPGLVNIPMHVIKNSFDLIAKPLTHNWSIWSFLDKLKIAKIIINQKIAKILQIIDLFLSQKIFLLADQRAIIALMPVELI